MLALLFDHAVRRAPLSLLALAPGDGTWPVDGASSARSLLAVAAVLGLIGLLAWAARRAPFGLGGRRGRSALVVETAVPLGDRRSLVIVSVEGRRLLLGLGPGQVSLVTELATQADSFGRTLDRSVGHASRSMP